jgi:hypothetical protein
MTPKLQLPKAKGPASTPWSRPLPYPLGMARKSLSGWKRRYRDGMRAWRRGRPKP